MDELENNEKESEAQTVIDDFSELAPAAISALNGIEEIINSAAIMAEWLEEDDTARDLFIKWYVENRAD